MAASRLSHIHPKYLVVVRLLFEYVIASLYYVVTSISFLKEHALAKPHLHDIVCLSGTSPDYVYWISALRAQTQN